MHQTRQEKQTPNPKLETLQILAVARHGPISHRTVNSILPHPRSQSPTDLVLPSLHNLQPGPTQAPLPSLIINHNKPSRRPLLVFHRRNPRVASDPIHSPSPAVLPPHTWTELSKARIADEMAIWVGKQKMSCRSCIKGHRSSTCNHLGGPLWAVRPAGRPNKACVHGPGDLCLCAHYFPLTWLKAAVPRNKKCSCQGSGSSGKKCMCGHNNGAAATTPDEETQPIFFQDLVARGLQVTTEPVDIEPQPPQSCCSGPKTAAPPTPAPSSCCSQPASTAPAAPIAAPAPSSCCSQPAKSEAPTPAPFANGNGHMKTESLSSVNFATPAPAPAPAPQFQSAPDFKVLAMTAAQAAHANNGDHVCNCGPTCNCVLCIDHPYNTATMNHIASEFGHMMTTNDSTVSPTIGSNGGTPAPFSQAWPSTNGAIANSMMTPAQPFNEAMMPHQSPPQQATDIFLNPADFQMFNFAFPLDNINQYDPQPDFSFGAMPPEMEMDMEMDMSGLCGGMPEGCPCGDDCACIGCQVHGKPSNGVPATNWS